MKTKIVTGLILAGGRASRMAGRDKGLLSVNGQMLIERCIGRFAPQTGPLLISANRHIDQYRQLGYPVLTDIVGEYYGPLAGLLSAQQQIETNEMVVVPCDAPFVPVDLVARLLAIYTVEQDLAVIPYDGRRLQPLFGLYTRKALDSLAIYIESGQRRVFTWVESLKPRIVDFSAQQDSFINVNSPDDLEMVKKLIHNDTGSTGNSI